MVERLKIAVEKARQQRAEAPAGPIVTPRAAPPPASDEAATLSWEALDPVELDPRHLERNRVICHAKTDPAHVAFDVLRTRILRVFAKNGWTRLGITSPSKACGKTFTAANLALSLSRQRDCRTVLVDMDLRAPALARTLGVGSIEPISWFLRGDAQVTSHLRRVGDNFALALNENKVADAAELVQAAKTAEVLETMIADLAPDIVIYDLPPMLVCDDVLGFTPNLDCVLLVAGGGRTKAAEITECERLLADQTQLLGVMLNRAEGVSTASYGYQD